MASQKIIRSLFQILIICLGFGCASSSNEMAYCPKVGVISDLDRVTEIEVAASQSKSNISLFSKIRQIQTQIHKKQIHIFTRSSYVSLQFQGSFLDS